MSPELGARGRRIPESLQQTDWSSQNSGLRFSERPCEKKEMGEQLKETTSSTDFPVTHCTHSHIHTHPHTHSIHKHTHTLIHHTCIYPIHPYTSYIIHIYTDTFAYVPYTTHTFSIHHTQRYKYIYTHMNILYIPHTQMQTHLHTCTYFIHHSHVYTYMYILHTHTYTHTYKLYIHKHILHTPHIHRYIHIHIHTWTGNDKAIQLLVPLYSGCVKIPIHEWHPARLREIWILLLLRALLQRTGLVCCVLVEQALQCGSVALPVPGLSPSIPTGGLLSSLWVTHLESSVGSPAQFFPFPGCLQVTWDLAPKGSHYREILDNSFCTEQKGVTSAFP